MDIQGWLQGTADRAPPNPSDEVDAPTFGPPTPIIKATNSKRNTQKRKRASSDSSDISLQQWAERRGKAGDRSADATRVRSADVSVTQSHSASRRRRPGSQDHGADGRVQVPGQKTYERRARRKTKPDRYESKKEDVRERKQREDAGERKSKRKRTRAHRGSDGKRTESLVQGFKLKNKPSNSRLTLKPDNTAGLFKHGRASAQMAGRKNGLPDLVFNELKFLRDHHQHQDERQPDSNDHRPIVQDKKREHENQEISAYFHQRTSRDRAHDPAPSRRVQIKQDDKERSDLAEGGSSPILPDEDLTSIPYLGFGSKGAMNHSGKPQPSATTYLTWSESATGFDHRVRRVASTKPTRESGQTSTSKKAQQRPPERDLTSQPQTDTVEPTVRKDPPGPPKGQWSTSRRTRGPAKVEVYIQQSNAEPDPSTSKRKSHDSTSMSLPVRPTARPARQRQQKGIVEQQALSSDVESFNTSDILKVKGRLEALAEETPPHFRTVRASQSDKENVQPISSSPIAKMLRIAHEAMAKSYQEPIRKSSKVTDQDFRRVDEDERGHNSPVSENEGPRPNRAHLRDLDVNGFAYQPMYAHATMRGEGLGQQMQHDAENVSAVGFDPGDDEMLDGYATFEPTFEDVAHATPSNVPAYMHAPPDTQSDLHSLPFRYEGPSTRARDASLSQEGLSTIHRDDFPCAATGKQSLLNEEDHIGDRDFEDGLEGFWRPNRLY